MKDISQIINDCFEFKGSDNSCKKCSISEKRCKIMIPILYNKTRGKNAQGERVRNSLEGFPFEDIKDIVKESISNIQNSIQKGRFRGKSDAQFIRWMEEVFHNKKVDYLREKKKEEEFQRYVEELKRKHTRTVSKTIKMPEQKDDSEYTESGNELSEDIATQKDLDPKENKLNTKKMSNLEELVKPCDSETNSSDVDDMIGFLKDKVGQEILNTEDIALIKALYEGNENGYTQSKMAEEMGLNPVAFKKRKSRLKTKLESSGFGRNALGNILSND